jgi:hypothetical protein
MPLVVVRGSGQMRPRWLQGVNAFAWKSNPAAGKKSPRIAALQIEPGRSDELTIEASGGRTGAVLYLFCSHGV